MKFIYIIFLLIIQTGVFGQTVEPYLVSTTSNNVSDTSVSISFSLGEIATSTISTSNYIVTEGFLQPHFADDNYIAIENSNNQIVTYPNPAENYINILFKQPHNNQYNYNLYNVLGDKIDIETSSNNKKVRIELANCSGGLYFLKITNKQNNKQIRTINISIIK